MITAAGPNNSTPGNVFNQTPSSGVLAQGSTVTIYVASTPTTPTTPPATPTPTPTAFLAEHRHRPVPRPTAGAASRTPSP